MATGEIRAMYAALERPVLVIGRDGRPQWHPVFDRNPKIARSHLVSHQKLVNGPGVRPYIAEKSVARWVWRPGQIKRGEIFLSAAEQRIGDAVRGFVMIEPNVKVQANRQTNKAWRWDRWQAVVDSGVARFVQCGPVGTRFLRNVKAITTASFREACGAMSACAAFVGTEGGLHHAAAALNVPAVVLYSEFIGPDVTGYAGQVAIRHAGNACGSRIPCQGCLRSMDAITVDEVITALRGTQ